MEAKKFDTRDLDLNKLGDEDNIHDLENMVDDEEVVEEVILGKDMKLTPDGGVLKKIIREGTGWKRPMKGDDVSVHYVGKLLDGTVFDSSRDRGERFSFKLGVGQVIKGWDIGIAEMKKSELSVLTCTAEYAYGAQGSPPKIPANATLQFEVELYSWDEEKDISENKDGGIMKKVLSEGEFIGDLGEESHVTINLIGKYNQEETDETVFLKKEDFEFVIGEEAVHPCIEACVKTMAKNEKSHFSVRPEYGFGIEGNKELGVPENAPLFFEIELTQAEKRKQFWEMGSKEKIEYGNDRRLQGNDLFRENKVKRALAKYSLALECLENRNQIDEEDQKEAASLTLPLHLNIAACELKLKNYPNAIKQATKALELDPSNIKAFIRRATAYKLQDDWDHAERDFQRGLEYHPGNRDLKVEFNKLKRLMNAHAQREKKKYSNMFEKMEKMRAQEEKMINDQKEMEKSKDVATDQDERVKSEEKEIEK